MSDLGKAVFLSYASQDAEAAGRICEALRQAGVETWFDQSELRGGDAWDQKIRRQIKECALFVPIITANTNARPEGYFRLEWKLAVDRSHLLADDHPFLFPIAIGEVSDATARVPDRFREVQWTRLRLDETPSELAARVGRLLAGEAPVREPAAAYQSGASGLWRSWLAHRRRRPAWLRYATAGVGLILALAYGLRPLWQPSRGKAASESSQAPAATMSEARQLVARARPLFETADVTNRENLLLAEQLCQRATTIDPADAEAWAASAQVSYLLYSYSHDRSPARRAAIAEQASRAMALAPRSVEARFSQSLALMRQGGGLPKAERLLREILVDAPEDGRVWCQLAHTVRYQGRLDEALPLWDRAAAAARPAPVALTDKAYALMFNARYESAEPEVNRVIEKNPNPRAYLLRTFLLLAWRGDLSGARRSLARIPPDALNENRGLNIAARVWLWSRQPDKCIETLQNAPQNFIDDIWFTGPKAFLVGEAHALAGRDEAARSEWETALRIVDESPSNDSADLRPLRCELLARVGRKEEAGRLFTELEQTNGAGWRSTSGDALRLLILLGRHDEALAAIPLQLNRRDSWQEVTPAVLRLDPAFDPLRPDPRFARLLVQFPVTKPEAAR